MPNQDDGSSSPAPDAPSHAAGARRRPEGRRPQAHLVEADDNRALSEGMQGLSVRLAKGLNRLMGRHGKVFADRFHAHVVTTPTETRNALAYVLLNHRSHMARIGKLPGAIAPDRFSSAAAFDGWQEVRAEPPKVIAAPRTWLLQTGWRRRGRLSLAETPAAAD